MLPVKHGVSGLVLEDYEWSPETGSATLLYSHEHDEDKIVATLHLAQPWLPNHGGWSERKEPGVLLAELRFQPEINYSYEED